MYEWSGSISMMLIPMQPGTANSTTVKHDIKRVNQLVKDAENFKISEADVIDSDYVTWQ